MDTTVCAPEPAGHGRGILLHWLAAGMWRSLAAHLLWEQGVGGSNPPIPTSKSFGDQQKYWSPSVLSCWSLR